MNRIHFWPSGVLLVLLAACSPAQAVRTETPTPLPTPLPPTQTLVPDWQALPGDLAADPSWTSDPVRLDFDMQLVDEALVVTAPQDLYANPIDTAGPHLEFSGDFAVCSTLESSTADFAGFSLYGALSQGEWWQGITRLDVGIKGGKLAVGYWNGSSPTPSVWQEFSAGGVFPNRKLDLCVRKLGQSLMVELGGRKAGEISDPGLFATGVAYLGLNVAPQNRMVLDSLTVEANHGSGVTVVR
jgi:hypothetical protein